MKLILGLGLGLLVVLVLGGLYLGRRVKRYAESFGAGELVGGGTKPPTMPMMDPEAFGRGQERKAD